MYLLFLSTCLAWATTEVSNSIDLAWEHFEQAQRLEHRGDFAKAHTHFSIASRLDPKNSDTWNNIALMSIKDVRLARARAEAAEFLRRFPADKRISILRDLIRQAEEHLQKSRMSEQETRQIIREIYLNSPRKHKD